MVKVFGMFGVDGEGEEMGEMLGLGIMLGCDMGGEFVWWRL